MDEMKFVVFLKNFHTSLLPLAITTKFSLKRSQPVSPGQAVHLDLTPCLWEEHHTDGIAMGLIFQRMVLGLRRAKGV